MVESTCRLSVKISLLCRPSVKLFNLRRLSVIQLIFLSLVGNIFPRFVGSQQNFHPLSLVSGPVSKVSRKIKYILS